jgi:RHS repeat-associated protein
MGYYAADTGESIAEFEYGPFGELIRATGEKKDDFKFKFSTKYEDAETGLLYYGFRYYNAETGRWLSRDPIEEKGGLNLYGYVGNYPIGRIDYLGLSYVGDLVTLLTDPEEFWIGKAEDKMKSILNKNPATKFWFTAAELGIAIGESVNREFMIDLADLDIALSLRDIDRLDRCMIRAGLPDGMLSQGRYACIQLEICASDILGRTATMGKVSYKRIVAALDAIPRGAAEFVKNKTVGILKEKASKKLGFDSKQLPLSDVEIAEDMGEFLLESIESEIKELKLP